MSSLEGDIKEAMMKFLTTTIAGLIAALSIAAVTPAVASNNPRAASMAASIDAASTSAKPAHLMLAQRRGKCTEDLGYGRTGSYGCG